MRGGSVVAGAGTSPGAHARGARAGRGGRSAGTRGGPGSGRVGRGRGPRARVGGAVGLRRPGSPGAGLGPRRWRVARRARGRGGGSLGGGAAAQGRAGPSVAPGGAPAGRRVAARQPGASHRGTGELQRRQTQGGARAARRGGRAAPLRGLRGRGGGGGGCPGRPSCASSCRCVAAAWRLRWGAVAGVPRGAPGTLSELCPPSAGCRLTFSPLRAPRSQPSSAG